MSEQPKKKGMNKWLLITLIVVGVAALGGTGYAVLKETNPMVMYVDALNNTINDQTERLSEYTEGQTELAERQLEEAYKSEGTLTMDANVQGDQIQQMLPQVAMVQGILSQVQIDMDSKYNPESNEIYGAMDVQMQGNSLANGNFYQNEDTFAAQAPFVYDQYFALGNEQLGAVMEKFGQPSEGLEEVPNFVEYAQSQLTQEEAEEMLKDYAIALGKEMKQEQFSLSEGEFEGETYDKVTIEISEEEARQMVATLLEKIKNDERIQQQLEQQAAMQGNVEGVAGVEDMQAELDKAIENIDQLKIPGGITGEAYLKDDLVAHQTWSMDFAPEEEEAVAFEMANSYMKESDDVYTSTFQVNISPESKEESITVNYEEKGEAKEDALHVDYTIGMAGDFEQESFNADLLLNTVYQQNSMNTDFELQLDGETFAQQPVPSISGFLNTASEKDGDDQVTQTTDFGLTLGMDDPNMGTISADLEFNFENALTFTDDLEFPALAEDNTVQLMDVSEEEMNNIGTEIQMNFQQHISSMMGGLGGLGGF
ncbi:hypothetical protein LCM20_08820 [Halobacillus litoralis]|uniref:DUF6583 family protein n=1 Tax=Halobacillus litoralis TaxID=45668 RepID=UPI001CD7A9AA|nr:DUF6583 family protein [Halobacillus litoralis]MCA0970688.1 hypothetical protein [Halobacillus litoralis]